MKKSARTVQRQIKKNPIKVILISSGIICITMLFNVACLYKTYDSAYDTFLFCKKEEKTCTIKKRGMLRNEADIYKFEKAHLRNIKIDKKQSLFGKKGYHLSINVNDENIAITQPSITIKEQKKYIKMVNVFLDPYNNFNSQVEFIISRHILRALGYCFSAVASLILMFLINDLIKKLKIYKKLNEEGINQNQALAKALGYKVKN